MLPYNIVCLYGDFIKKAIYRRCKKYFKERTTIFYTVASYT